MTAPFALQLFTFIRSLNFFFLVAMIMVCSVQKVFCCFSELKDFPAFYSIIVSASGFILKMLIHFVLTFVPGDKHGSTCILLHESI